MDFVSLFDPKDSIESNNNKKNDGYNHNKKSFRKAKKKDKAAKLQLQQDDDESNANIVLDFEQGILPPEPQLGNIEYKLKLINPTSQRFEHLVTQMKWRLREGKGEAVYEIGVQDSGFLHGLSDADMAASLDTLKKMANKLGASTTILRRKTVSSQRSVAEVLVRKIPDDQHSIEVRVSVLGGVNAGKSTLLGVLTQGELDNGRGSARLNMFRHRHEIQSGRTSCISHEAIGFDTEGNVINLALDMMTAEEISEKSSKLVTFMDLAGHRRYLKTTVQALTGYSPHFSMLVVSAEGINSMTYEHLDLIQALDMSYFIVVTKIENTSPDATLTKLKSIIASVEGRKMPFLIQTNDDVITAGARQFPEQIVPIFYVSNVTGEGLDLLTRFLFLLSPGISNAEKDRLEQEPYEFLVDEIFKIPGVGSVVGGLLIKGVLTEDTQMRIGPLQDGSFYPVTVQSIHRNRAACRMVRAGQSGSLAFLQDENLPPLRSGMILLPTHKNASNVDLVEPYGSWFFQAKISVLFHATAIYEGFQTTVHIGSIRQTAVIEGIMGCGKIGTNEQASVLFRFMCHPEYVISGQRILFREGKNKGIGIVTQAFPINKQQVD
ncbi:GTP-binding protein 2 [Sitodiplosis mosellana]|uniref:GTP-binding protein 2 n=1 Tax=Sitodiplosis mosellana TaxID=263140 RepID=UPI0024448B68|nr:GTP-binding protein 2 [Sitodiplosis mosellana]XP_055324716.1 GTP-binding protein 2 [Sitodiplosis mosellana]XP_055324717.1 GTP-binding protein 2 [Sitodiplosis mosellana]